MMNDNRQLEERQFVEDVGIFFEREGMPRMAGRALGWLMICDPPHQSSAQLAEALMASKGSISTTTRLLIGVGLVERHVIPGVRHDYFRIKPGAWHHVMERSANQLKIGRQIAERGLELTKDKNLLTRKWLEEMRDLYAFLEREFPALLERWERE
jgi:DNA-binding transcriptional regulator GbsR (MarR family)